MKTTTNNYLFAYISSLHFHSLTKLRVVIQFTKYIGTTINTRHECRFVKKPEQMKLQKFRLKVLAGEERRVGSLEAVNLQQ